MKREIELDAKPDEIDSIAANIKQHLPLAKDGSVHIVERRFIRVFIHDDVDATQIMLEHGHRIRKS